jgi:hypothetical protein
MSQIFLASYVGTHSGWQGNINRGIRWLDKTQYSHSELAIGNPSMGPSFCISSSGVEGGVRGKAINLNSGNWEVLPMPWVLEEDALAFLEHHRRLGTKYDYMGTARFAVPFFAREHQSRMFCSEVVAAIAGFDEPWRFTPATLHSTVAGVLRLLAKQPA